MLKPTIENIKKAGLELYRVKNMAMFDVLKKIEIINNN